jgi:hypothetical protein
MPLASDGLNTYTTRTTMVTRRVIRGDVLIRVCGFLPLGSQQRSAGQQRIPMKNAPKPLKGISQADGHVFHFIWLQAAVSGSRYVLHFPHFVSMIKSPSFTLVDSEICEVAASQKMDLLTRVESVLVGSVKMSEWRAQQTALCRRHRWASDLLLHPRA